MSENGVLKFIESAPDAGVVELLEELLEAARRGEVVGICGVTRNAAREFGEFTSKSAREDAVHFLAYTRVLQMRLERQIKL